MTGVCGAQPSFYRLLHLRSFEPSFASQPTTFHILYYESSWSSNVISYKVLLLLLLHPLPPAQDSGILMSMALWSAADNLPVLKTQYAFMHQPCSSQFLLLHSLARTHSALRWKASICLLAFTLQMRPNVSTFREIWVEDNKHCAMSQLIHSAFWRTKMPKYFYRSECARLERPGSEWFRFGSCSLMLRPALSLIFPP